MESSVFELTSKTGDYRLLFWQNTSAAVALDFAEATCQAMHVDWWGMKLEPMGSLTGTVLLKPPAGPDSAVQLLCS